MTHELTSAQIVGRLSADHDALDLEHHGMTRRRFLEAVAWGVGGGVALAGADAALGIGSAVGGSDNSAWAASPVRTDQGILVTVFMYGGNDALNTVVPYTSASYYGYRGTLAIPAANVLPLDATLGLHPALPYLHSLYRAGKVAVLPGIGVPKPNMSHFTSQASWMFGSASSSYASSGWIGRWLDGLDDYDALRAVTIGSQVPLSVVGQRRRGTAVPNSAGGFGSRTGNADRLMYQAMRSFSAAPAGRGDWHDAIAQVEAAQLDVVGTVNPLLTAALPTGTIQRRLAVAARLINANLGVRVIDMGWDGFDTHSAQAAPHQARLAELDEGLRLFYESLDPGYHGQVTVLVLSEFGRAPWANASAGTDHGQAGVAFVIGNAVAGGVQSAYPNLDGVARSGQLAPTLDFRSVYAGILERWLGADPATILGGSYAGLPLFASGPLGGSPVVAPPVPVSPSLAGDYVPLSPMRILDTRNGDPLQAGRAIDVVVLGQGGVPTSGVTSVAVNLTMTGGTAASYVTAWPAGEARPEASNANWSAGQTVPNLAVIRPGANGSISLWSAAGTTHALVDVVGYFRESGNDRLLPLSPYRLLDTRTGVGAPSAPVGPGGSIDLRVLGVDGSGIPASGVDAVVLNMTVDQPTTESYLTVWPKGEPMPTASSLNFVKGQTVANLVITKLGADGTVSIFNADGQVNVLADVVGCFTAAGLGRHHSLSPTRILDTRNGFGASGRIGTSPLTLPIAGVGGVPTGALGAILNVTVTEPSATSYLTCWPTGEAKPTASSLNFTAGLTVANLVIVKLGSDGSAKFANAAGTTHILADVLGYFI